MGTDSSIKVTVTAGRGEDVQSVVDQIVKALGGKSNGRSDVVSVKEDRFGATVSFDPRVAAPPRAIKPPAKPKVERALTSEQGEVKDASLSLKAGENMAVAAFAGTGKTSLLVACAQVRPEHSLLYMAFNKGPVEEARSRFPRNVKTGTAHAISRQMVPEIQGRQVGKMDMQLLASVVAIPSRIGPMNQRKLAWLTHTCVSNFADDDALDIDMKHVPHDMNLKLSNSEGRIMEYARKTWNAIVEGSLPLQHYAYLKMWQLDLAQGKHKGPRYDLVLLDEAQDVNPVMASIVSLIDAPLIRVGDPFQSIYSWRGAIDALDAGGGKRYHLTQSFRFGPNIAGLANRILTMHPDFYKYGKLITGAAQDHPLGTGPEPDVVLCRSNAGVLDEALSMSVRGIKAIHVVGGIDDLCRLVEDACDLKNRMRPKGREFADYSSWEELIDEIEAGMAGDIAFIAKFVEGRGIAEARYSIARLKELVTAENEAEVVISTIHKAKGLEWDSVRLAPDNRNPEDIGKMYVQAAKSPSKMRATMEEVNLLYVAVTRARKSVRLPADLLPLAREGFKFKLPERV